MKSAVIVTLAAMIGAYLGLLVLSQGNDTYTITTLHSCMGLYAGVLAIIAACYCIYVAIIKV